MEEKNYLSKEALKKCLKNHRNKISRVEFIVDPNMDLPGIDVNSLLNGHILMYFDTNDDYSGELISWTIHIVSPDKIYLKGDWSFAFSDLKKLISIEGLENLDTSEVTNMMLLFYNCQNLKSLDLSKLDTSNVKDTNSMFYGCTNLKELNLGNINPSIVNCMFSGCSSLEEIHIPLSPLHDEIYKNNIDVVFDSIEESRMQDAIITDSTVAETYNMKRERKM